MVGAGLIYSIIYVACTKSWLQEKEKAHDEWKITLTDGKPNLGKSYKTNFLDYESKSNRLESELMSEQLKHEITMPILYV